MKNKISVILPAYNCERYIHEAIQSILDQSYQNFELIIVYDRSTDNTLRCINFFKKNKKIKIIHGKSKGLIDALNKGLLVCNGDFIARMDADDISHKDRLKIQINFMIEKKIDLCGCHYNEIDSKGKYIRTKQVPLLVNNITHYLLFTVPFAHGSVMIRKSFLDSKNLKYSDKVSNAEDYKLWVDCYSNGAVFGNVNVNLYNYRRLPNSAMSSNMTENFKECRKIRKELIDNQSDKIFEIIRMQFSKYPSFNTQEKIYYILANYFLLIYKRKNLFFKLIKKANILHIFLFLIYLVKRT